MADYVQNDRPGRAEWLLQQRSLGSLRECVRRAGLAQRHGDLKREDHQRRIKRAALGAFERRLAARLAAIRRCRSFSELHGLVLACRVPGVGALAVYDAAQRIGAFLRIEPEHVYVHAGVRDGAKALGLPVERGLILAGSLPREFSRLTPDEVEDFLCRYKRELRRLAGGGRGAAGRGAAAR